MEDTGVKVDKTFLTKVLGDERFELLSYDVNPGSKPGDNFLSLIYSIKVELQDKINKSLSTHYLLLKCYPNHPSRQEFNNQINIFYKELQMYSTWFPELVRFLKEVLKVDELPYKIPYPPFVYGTAIDFSKHDPKEFIGKTQDPLDNAIVMEDMKRTWGFRMTNRREPLDIHHMRLVIQALAKVHALSWAYKHHDGQEITEKYPFLKNSLTATDFEIWASTYDANFDKAIGVLEKELGNESYITKAAVNFKSILRQVLRAFMGEEMSKIYSELIRVKPEDNYGEEPWIIVAHGDCWSNNFLFRYDESSGNPVEVTLVDLQFAQHGCLTTELAYVIYASSNTDLRKKHLHELLQTYHDTFNEVCNTFSSPTLPGFTFESLKGRFHKEKLTGYMLGIAILPMILQEHENAVNMEEMEKNKNITDLIKETQENDSEATNVLYKARVIELTEELYNEGVI